MPTESEPELLKRFACLALLKLPPRIISLQADGSQRGHQELIRQRRYVRVETVGGTCHRVTHHMEGASGSLILSKSSVLDLGGDPDRYARELAKR